MDHQSSEYWDILKKSDALKQIAIDIGTEEGAVVTRKFYKLRSQYSTEKRKRAANKSGSEGAKAPRKWEFFELLEFLNNSVQTRKSMSNLSQSIYRK